MTRYSIKSVSLCPPHFKWATIWMRLRASLHCVFTTLMCFLNEGCESHHRPKNLVDSSTGRSVLPILTMAGLWTRDRGAVKCATLHLWAANLKSFLVAHSCMALTACCRCLSMVSRERPRKQIARSSTKNALKTWICWSLKFSDTKTGSLPLRPILWKSRMMPYCQVVYYAFSKSMKRPTACCLCAKASMRYLSRLTRWSMVLQCFLKPHCLLSSIPNFQDTRWSEYWSCVLWPCICSWSVQ